jgi:hypothetical protein
LILQEPASLGFLRRRAIVLPAVDFHDQPDLVARKVGNVVADRYLAAELVPLYLLRAQYLPDPLFRLSRVLPQNASSRACAVDGVLLHVSTCAAGNISPSQPPPSRGRAPPHFRGAVEAGGDRVERDVGPALRVHELFPAPIEETLVVLRDVAFGDEPWIIRIRPRMPHAHRQILVLAAVT